MADGAVAPNPQPAPTEFSVQGIEVFFRVLKKKKYLQRENLSDAFLLGTDEAGLSVCYNCLIEEAQAVAALDSEGAAALAHDRITALLLTVAPDSPNHAEIQRVPHKETNRAEAERLAIALANCVTNVYRQIYRRTR